MFKSCAYNADTDVKSEPRAEFSISSNVIVSVSSEILVDSFDIATGKISYSIGDEESVSPFKVGDKIALSVSLSWTNSEWSDRISIVSPLKIVRILDITVRQSKPPDLRLRCSLTAVFMRIRNTPHPVPTMRSISSGRMEIRTMRTEPDIL